MLCHRIRPAVIAVLLCLPPALCGCGEVPDSRSAGSQTSAARGGETPAEKCRRKLAAAIRRLGPQTLTMQSDPERSVTGLNSWIASCASDQCAELQLTDEALALLSNNPRCTAARYSGGDAIYIRDALAMRDLHIALSSRGATKNVSATERDVARVLQSFDWVVRNISLMAVDEKRPPLGLFDVALTGRGTAEDRAWIFAELLRQQQTDAILIQTTVEPEKAGLALDTAKWLVAVIQDDHGWLFDMVTGLPVVGEKEFDVNKPEPLMLSSLKDHDRWKDTTVQIIAQVATFAPRMLVLQDSLAADDSAILFEELTGGVSEIRPVLDRILAAGGDLWDREDLSIWPYPEDQVISSNSLSETQRTQYKDVMRSFEAPFERDVFIPESPEEQTSVPEEMSEEQRMEFVQQRMMEVFVQVTRSTEKLFGKPSFRLLKARTKQVSGSTETGIIQQMQQIRLSSLDDVIEVRVPDEVRKVPGNQGMPEVLVWDLPTAIKEVNRSSTGNSLYWTAMSQIDRDEVGMAISTLKNYRRQFPEGTWSYPSMVNQAMALLMKDRPNDAREILQEADVEGNPERLRVQRLLNALGTVDEK